MNTLTLNRPLCRTCSRRIRPQITGRDTCAKCYEKTGYRSRRKRSRLPNPMPDAENASQDASRSANDIRAHDLWSRMQREPGWPKGIIRTEHGYTFISAGLIDDWAHYRTKQFVGVCDSSTSVGDVQFMLSA